MAGAGRGRRRGRARYAVRDWAAYDRALARRGDIRVWVSPDAVAGWHRDGMLGFDGDLFQQP